MKIGYFDCFAGASGDMIAGAMVAAGLDGEFLQAQLDTLGIEGLEVTIGRTKRAGLAAVKFEASAAEQQPARNLEQISKLIGDSGISDAAKKTAIAIFDRLAQAEAAVHEKDPKDIHFHEVGAVDSIADIVSASVGLEALGIEKVYCSALSVGGGTVKCEHGLLPVPAPATAELLKGVPISGGPGEFEQVTPTGAAILTTVAEDFGPLPAMRIEAVGYGAGSADPAGHPNVLRLILGRAVDDSGADADSVCVLETNVDDASGELIGFVMNKLLAAGALDVYATPIFMKQNRPGVQISVICEVQDTAGLERILFEQGITLGIRKQIVARSKLVRDFAAVATDFGQIRIKTGLLAGGAAWAKPEFSDCVSAADRHKVPVKAVMEAAIAAYEKARSQKQHGSDGPP
ncbi:MAG: nickel pincer cofactor biosynthesis protein LarC [Planctomycetota bacterium]